MKVWLKAEKDQGWAFPDP